MLRGAVIGFGGLGKIHFMNLLALSKQRMDFDVVAICNDDLTAIKTNVKLNIGNVSVDDVDFSKYNLYTNYKEMIEKENLDFVFIALPTYLHCEVAVYCMEQGLHVYIEKPMALNPEQCALMIETSRKYDKSLMVGHCLRFTEEYIYLKNLVETEGYGKVVKAEFSRKSPVPSWSYQNWMLDDSKSGGCIVDMAVHDIDIINWIFGTPDNVHSISSHNMASYESVYAILSYPEMMVSLTVDWGIHSSFEFCQGYAVIFENAYVEHKDSTVTVYTHGDAEVIELVESNSHMKEAVEFIEAIADGKPFSTADVASVYESMKLLFDIKYNK